MTEKIIELNYDFPIDYIYNITTNNNEEIITKYEDITSYTQGEWKNNKRKDLIELKLKDTPEEIKSILKLFISNDKILTKTKIKLLEQTEKKIIMKIQIKLINKLSNLILKLFKYKIRVIYETTESNKTNLKIIYKIKSLISSNLTKLIDDYIETTIKEPYLKIYNDYILSLPKMI